MRRKKALRETQQFTSFTKSEFKPAFNYKRTQ